eukprot:tig00000681_g3094.t1
MSVPAPQPPGVPGGGGGGGSLKAAGATLAVVVALAALGATYAASRGPAGAGPAADELERALGYDPGAAPRLPRCPAGQARDFCGVCGGDGSTCTSTGCPAGMMRDRCGVCGGNGMSCTDAGCPAGQLRDRCGACGGDNSTCTDPACIARGFPEGRLDRCGDCTLDPSRAPAICPTTGCPPGQDKNNSCRECWTKGREKPVCDDGCAPGQAAAPQCGPGVCIDDRMVGSPNLVCPNTGCPPYQRKNECGECSSEFRVPPGALCRETQCPPGQDKNNACHECWWKGQEKPECSNGCPKEAPKLDIGCGVCVEWTAQELAVCPETGCPPGQQLDLCGWCTSASTTMSGREKVKSGR